MKAKQLMALLKKLPEEAEVYFDDGKGGLIEICRHRRYTEMELKHIRPDLKPPVIVLSD